jgi:hypothetical protein
VSTLILLALVIYGEIPNYQVSGNFYRYHNGYVNCTPETPMDVENDLL